MSNRRKLRPHELARKDQAFAEARDAARDPSTAVLVTDVAPGGVRCSWCDCPWPDSPGSPHAQPGYTCPGCPQDADYVVSWLNNENYPVCGHHYGDLVDTFTTKVIPPGVPVEFGRPWEDAS